MAFRWRADDGPTLNAGLVFFKGIWTSIAKESYIFVIFQMGPDPLSPPPPGSAHVKVLAYAVDSSEYSSFPFNKKVGQPNFCILSIFMLFHEYHQSVKQFASRLWPSLDLVENCKFSTDDKISLTGKEWGSS